MVKKRNGMWYTDFRCNGCRIRRSTQTSVKKEAVQFAHQLRARLYAQNVLGEQPRRTWREAVVRFSREAQSNRSWRDTRRHLAYLDGKVGRLYLDQITNDIVEAIIAERLQEGVSGATVNRYLATLKAVLRKARDQYEWIDRIPYIRKLPESEGRLRWLTRDEYEKLVGTLPSHAKLVVQFAVHTGLRSSNIFGLEWDQIDLGRRLAWIYADQHKNGQARSVPLNSEAISVLERLNGESHHPKYVFTYQGKPLKGIRTALALACERLGLKEVTFHTFRHTYASWLAQSEVPLQIVQELGGWKSSSMVKRYAHLARNELGRYQQYLVDGHKSGHTSTLEVGK